MTGIVKTFLPEKQYGFIKGDDGKDYFFHESNLLRKDLKHKICEGLFVHFEQKATPKGYSALDVVVHEIDENKIKFIVPTTVETSKSDTFKDWEVVYVSNFVLHGSSRNSPDEAKKELLSLAKHCNANGIIELEYYKTTGSEMSNNFNLFGTYHYTIHNFKGRLVGIGRKSMFGINTKEELSKIENNIKHFTKHNHNAFPVVWVLIGIFVFFTILLGLK